MKTITPISLYPTLVGASVDFLKREGMDCLITQEGLPHLITQLLHYKEEGKILFPAIYIFDDLELVKRVLPNSQFCFIGTADKSRTTMLKALKKCAPLTESDWSIYILRKQDKLDFGVFRAGTSLLSMTIAENLIENGTDNLKVILIHQISDKLIEVRGVKSDPLLISYGNQDNSPIDSQNRFIETIIEHVKPKVQEPTKNFFRQVFLKVLQQGHGTLACVMDNKKKRLPQRLQDGIFLKERINIPQIIEELLDKDDLQANSKLQGQFSLITGMMQSDGITVFTDNGEVASYNVFVKHPEKIVKIKTIGGARSRTFLTLSEMIGKGIKSVYIQSQDGAIEFKNGK